MLVLKFLKCCPTKNVSQFYSSTPLSSCLVCGYCREWHVTNSTSSPLAQLRFHLAHRHFQSIRILDSFQSLVIDCVHLNLRDWTQRGPTPWQRLAFILFDFVDVPSAKMCTHHITHHEDQEREAVYLSQALALLDLRLGFRMLH
jgi:hypothetical protein